MTTNYSESYSLSTKSQHRQFLFYVRRKGYNQKLFRRYAGKPKNVRFTAEAPSSRVEIFLMTILLRASASCGEFRRDPIRGYEAYQAAKLSRCTKESTIRIFHSLRYRDYALFWCTDLLGSIGHFVQEVALFWITYEITGSAMALGILGLCSAAPRLILGALSGVLVDRYDRKLLLILVQFISAIPIAIFLAIYALGALAFWHLLVLEILFGSIRAINPSAAQSILSELVPREDLMNAVSLYTVGFNIARIAGPSLGGVLILWIGIGGCYAAFAVTLLVSGVGMLFIRTKKEESVKPEENFLREFKEGFQYVWHAPVILSSIIAAYTFAVFIVTYQSFLPVFAKEVLQVGPEGLGILMAAPGLGGIASLSFLASVGERWNRAMLLWVMTTTTPIFLMLFCAIADLLAVGRAAGPRRRGPGKFPHHQPGDHPDRSAAQSHGPGDERVQSRSRHARHRFHCPGRFCNLLRRLPRPRAHRRRFIDRDDDDFLSFAGQKRTTSAIM